LRDSFATRVIAWQAAHGRHDMPWQRTRDPYRVWLSEVMLQQTQVATVLPYYERFVARFPDVRALAAAPLDDVLSAWSGLGYYSRARHLHRCAQLVVARHGGSFPASSEALAALPGIGRSTAAAIAAFCFDERAAILDGNVKRVLARWLRFGGDLAQPACERALWARATEQLPEASGIAAYTQGLMDLGATVCLARAPNCLLCPVAEDCGARLEGAPQRYPLRTRRSVRGRREAVWLWLEWRDALWLVQRPERGVWASLWSLPEFDTFDRLATASRGWPGTGVALPSIRHVLTHFDWLLHPRRWTLPAALDETQANALAHRCAGGGRWFGIDDALAIGLPAPLRSLLQGAPASGMRAAPARADRPAAP
jgi:A/G-specific adenine glycosylase